MSSALIVSLLTLIVFVTHFQEAITGFGCTVLALPFVAWLLGMKLAVKVLVIQAWILTAYIALTARKSIDWRQYGRIVLFAGLGFPLGRYLGETLPEDALKTVLGVFMLFVGARGLYVQYHRNGSGKWAPSRFVNWLMNCLLGAGGAIHGAFASGGPFVVIYASRALTDKAAFRATLCMLWFTLNTAMVASYAAAQTLTAEIGYYTAICTPFTVLGMFVGDHFHHRIDENVFRVLVYGVLLLSGGAVVYDALA